MLLGEEHGVEDEGDGQLEGDVTARLDNDNDNALGRNHRQEDASYADQTVEENSNGDITFDAKGGQQQQQEQKRDRREPEWADQASPFEILRQDIGKIQVSSSSSRPPPSTASAATAATSDASYASSSYIPAPTLGSSGFTAAPAAGAASGNFTAKAAARNQARLRDLSMDSPDVYRPTLHDPTFNAAAPGRDSTLTSREGNDAKGKARQQQSQKEEAEAQDYRNHRENPSYFYNDPPTGGRGDTTTDHGTPASLSSSFDLSNLEPPSVLHRDGGRERENPSSGRPDLGPRQISAGTSNTAKKAALLQKVLTKNMVGKDGRPNASTPAKGLVSRNTAAAAAAGHGKDFFPLDLPSDWNGIADLSKTPLSSFESPQKSTISRSFFQHNDEAQNPTPLHYGGQRLQSGSTASSSSIFGGGGLNAQAEAAGGTDASLSFADYIKRFNPPTHSLSPSASSSSHRLSRTPAKEAARIVSRDVLERATTAISKTGYREEVLDSPGGFDPPSVVKNWATRGYAIPTSASASAGRGGRRMTDSPNSFGGDSPVAGGQLSRMQQQQKMPSSMLGNAGDEEEEGDSFEAEFDDNDAAAAQPLAAPPPQPNFRHLADDGDELGLSQGAVIGSNTSQPVQQQQPAPGGEEWGGDSFEDDDDEEGESFDDPPIPVGQGDNIAYEDQQVPLKDEGVEGDSFDSDNNASRSFEEETLFGAARRNRDSEGFRLNGPEDMVTLHGGRLLESQPFEASPLAGRDARYGL